MDQRTTYAAVKALLPVRQISAKTSMVSMKLVS